MTKQQNTYVALLRGINVGGRNSLPMSDLADIFARAGCTQVQTYIQSGNVIFNAEKDLSKKLPYSIAEAIEAQFGFKSPIALRTLQQMQTVAANNPFLQTGAAQDQLHVYFLANSPTINDISKLDKQRSAPDQFDVSGCEIYLRLENGVSNTKLSNTYFDSKLSTTCTLRNWRTVLKLIELMRDREGTLPSPAKNGRR